MTKKEILIELFEKNKKEMLKAVKQPNAFGNTQTEFAVYPDRIEWVTHLTPAKAMWTDDPLFVFDVRHNPFKSYRELRDEFMYQLEWYFEMQEEVNEK